MVAQVIILTTFSPIKGAIQHLQPGHVTVSIDVIDIQRFTQVTLMSRLVPEVECFVMFIKNIGRYEIVRHKLFACVLLL